jgi:hypothetical protein
VTNQERLPPMLAELGRELRAAAERDIEIERQVHAREDARRWPRRRRNALIFAVGALACAGAGAGASGVFDADEGRPIERDPAPQMGDPAADPNVVTSSATADPAGGLPWAVKVFTNDAGQDCVRVGRLRAGALGRVVDGRFRALPDDASATACADLERQPLLVARQAVPGADARTIVYGIARDRRPVKVTLGGPAAVVRPRGQGAFVVVRRGIAGTTAVETTDARGAPVRWTAS